MAFGSPALKSLRGSAGQQRGYTMVLQLESTTTSDRYNCIGALYASGVPRIWDSFDPDGTTTYGDDRCFCVDKSADLAPQQPHNGALYLVTCQFQPLSKEQKRRKQHPLDRPAEITDGANFVTVAYQKDINSAPILNKAKQPFDPGAEGEKASGVVTVTRNFASRKDRAAYLNKVNNGTFLGGAAGTVRCADFQQVSRTEEFDELGDGNSIEVEYWEVSVTFEENPDGWQVSLLNAGRYELDGNGDPVAILGGDGLPVADPWPLDNSGQMIASANLPGSEVYLDFDVLGTANFDAIGLFA